MTSNEKLTIAKWIMRYLWAILAFAVAFLIIGWLWMKPAKAAEIDHRFNRSTCYSWEGGRGSAGSHSQCDPIVVSTVVAVPGPVRVEKVEVPVVVTQTVPCVPPPKVKPTKPKQRYTCEGKWVPVK